MANVRIPTPLRQLTQGRTMDPGHEGTVEVLARSGSPAPAAVEEHYRRALQDAGQLPHLRRKVVEVHLNQWRILPIQPLGHQR